MKRLTFLLTLTAAALFAAGQPPAKGAKGGARSGGRARAGGQAHHSAPHAANKGHAANRGKMNAAKSKTHSTANGAMKSNVHSGHGATAEKAHHASAAHSQASVNVNNANPAVRVGSYYSRSRGRYYYARRGHRYYRRLLAAGQRPSFVRGPDQVVAVNSGPHNVAPWATFISAGRTNGAHGALRFQVTRDTQPGLFRSPPRVSPTGVLTFTPAPGKTGTAVITLVLRGGGGGNGGGGYGGGRSSRPQSFQITVGS
jgi:hypothetical protein